MTEMQDIPWTSFGRETPISKVGRSLFPVGIFAFDLAPSIDENTPFVDTTTPEGEAYLMNIVGTAFQAGENKLVTCTHVIKELFKVEEKRPHYILGRIFRGNTVLATPYSIKISIPFIDDRTKQPNPKVDLAILYCPVRSTPERPYEAPPVTWGDSTALGVGDSVIVGGYPYGTEMFLYTQSNRGLIQPTFYPGIISAILPATRKDETRLLQISTPLAGGMSGGVVILPKTGEVVGMVTSCVHTSVEPSNTTMVPLPISYAIPSEVIKPFVENVTFEKQKRKRNKG